MKYIIYFLLITLNTLAQEVNYIQYHKDINKAEEFFFLKNDVDSTLYYYDKVFNSYEFIFVKDLMNAAQIAIFSNKPYQKYIEQGFENGLKLSHLKKYPLFSKISLQLATDKKILKSYHEGRKKYISRIDFDYLDKIYKMAISDQQLKSNKNYDDYVLKTTDKLIDFTKSKGFPGEKLIGVSDSTIFKEINKPHLDLYEQRKKDPNLFYMLSDEHILAQHWPIIMLVHNDCAYKLYHKTLLDEIKKGNIHPRDVGLIYDNMFRYIKSGNSSYCGIINYKGVYRLNMFTNYSKFKDVEQTNKMRASLYIVSTNVDEKKIDYEFDYGFRFFTGFWNCR